MIDIIKNYRTRDGREVRLYATDGEYPCKIHGAFKTEKGEWRHAYWTSKGSFVLAGESDSDLIEMKPRHKRAVWLNLYPNDDSSPWAYKSKKEADQWGAETRIACIKVELDFEEGEGL